MIFMTQFQNYNRFGLPISPLQFWWGLQVLILKSYMSEKSKNHCFRRNKKRLNPYSIHIDCIKVSKVYIDGVARGLTQLYIISCKNTVLLKYSRCLISKFSSINEGYNYEKLVIEVPPSITTPYINIEVSYSWFWLNWLVWTKDLLTQWKPICWDSR